MEFKKMFVFSIFMSILIVMLSVFASASFGIGFSKGVNIKPGETVDKVISIQNVIEPTGDIIVEATIEEGEEYVSFIGENRFNVAAGETVPVNIRVSAPASADAGDVYDANIVFRTVSSEEKEGGTVQFAFGIGKSFTVNVIRDSSETVEGEQRSAIGLGVWIWILLIVVVIILVVWYLIKRSTSVELDVTAKATVNKK